MSISMRTSINGIDTVTLEDRSRTGYVEIYGLSTDTKPTDVPNGTPFLEMDTKQIFLFDAEHEAWLGP